MWAVRGKKSGTRDERTTGVDLNFRAACCVAEKKKKKRFEEREEKKQLAGRRRRRKLEEAVSKRRQFLRLGEIKTSDAARIFQFRDLNAAAWAEPGRFYPSPRLASPFFEEEGFYFELFVPSSCSRIHLHKIEAAAVSRERGGINFRQVAEISRVCSVGNTRWMEKYSNCFWRGQRIGDESSAGGWRRRRRRGFSPSLLVPASIRFIRRYRVSTVVRLLMNQTGRRATRLFGMCSSVVRLTLRKLWETLLWIQISFFFFF